MLKQCPYKEICKHEVLHSNRDLMLFPMKQREIHLKMCLRYLPQMLLKWSNLLGMNKSTLFEECPRDSNMNGIQIWMWTVFSHLPIKRISFNQKVINYFFFPKENCVFTCNYVENAYQCICNTLPAPTCLWKIVRTLVKTAQNTSYDQAKYLMT